MAAQAFGLLLTVDEVAVRYDCGTREDDPLRGVVVIPIAEPESWYMEGRSDRPRFAKNIVGRALNLRERTGAWPKNASFQS